MPEHIRLTDLEGLERVRGILERKQWPVLVSFASEVTHHPVLVVPATTVEHVGFLDGYGGSPEQVYYVGIVEYGNGLYPLLLGHLHSSDLTQKLKMTNVVDARNVAVFLNALGHPDGVRSYLSTVPLRGDHVDHHSEALRV